MKTYQRSKGEPQPHTIDIHMYCFSLSLSFDFRVKQASILINTHGQYIYLFSLVFFSILPCYGLLSSPTIPNLFFVTVLSFFLLFNPKRFIPRSSISVADRKMGHELMVVAAPPTSLAPGFRFHPTDEELVRYYLRRKACGKPFRFQAVSEIDVYKSEPWELAEFSSLKTRDLEWYFFSPVDRKYGNGYRLNRATGKGYWKATGKDRSVRHKSETIGMKKTLVFHSGRAPDGKRTNWVMHEYRLLDQELSRAGVAQDAFVLCRIFQKSGLGPPNGDRYAPFVEEEWDNDAALLIPGGEAEDDMTHGDETCTEGNDIVQITPANEILYQSKPQTIPFVCKRELYEDCALTRGPKLETFSLFHNKRLKQTDPNGNGSEDSTTSQDPRTTQFSTPLLEFPLLDTIEAKESYQPTNPSSSFDAATLEKSVPPGYLKFISNLEIEILSISMEKEKLKIEVMRAQAMINILQSRVELLSEENDKLKTSV